MIGPVLSDGVDFYWHLGSDRSSAKLEAVSAPETPPSSRRKKLLRGAFLIVVLGGAYTTYLHFRNRLAIVGGDRKVFRILPRESFGAKPIIDVKMPVIGQVTYPEKGDLPQGYLDTPGVSGLLLVDPMSVLSNTANFDDSEKPKWDFGADGIAESGDAGDQLFIYTRDALVVRCPFVFGKSPRIAKVTVGEDLEVEVKVPASGKPEPDLPSANAPAGKWKVRLEPLPWISPSFRLRYRITLEGPDPNPARFVEIWGQPDTHAWFTMHDGDTKEFSMENWYTTQPLYIRIYVIEEVPIRLKAIVGERQFELVYAGTGPSAKTMREMKISEGEYAYSNNGWDNRFAALRAEAWTMYGEGFVGRGRPVNWQQIKNGQVFEATGYRRMETGKADVTLKLPRLRDYERTRLPATSSSPFNDY